MKPYGLLAEFANADALVAAVRVAREHGYTTLEAYSPFHIDALDALLGVEHHPVPALTLLGGVLGGAAAYFLQWYSAVIDYPIDVGGRPLHSWPSFLPATFEMTVLGAALFAVLGMLVLNGLPRLHHPLFAIEEFAQATRHRFFLCLPARDRAFVPAQARALLVSMQPIWIGEVPA